MRLLEFNDDAADSYAINHEFSLVHFSKPPQYAILSHTWGPEEVTFEEMMNNNIGIWVKAGYNKIRFCGDLARRDGLRDFWVDTCCIDHRSGYEVEEAINSMFRWYQNATKCYVYLSDVSMPPFNPLDKMQKQSVFERFAESRWFTRGWTLPELLAPKSVEFFSREGMKLGDKKSLEGLLCRITGIPDKALQGSPLSNFSITERISWQESRETTRQEDKYYSLLGIFGVSMPVLYGEGREKAFRRLTGEIERGRDLLDASQALILQHYRPLKDFGFRTLQFHQQERGDVINCYMREFNLLDPVDYNALSYVWGHEPAIHRIIVNDKPFFIRPNLFQALQRIMAQEVVDGLSVKLWVDSVCIDQSNEAERGAQVRRMADIFQNAINVWIWLGEEDLTSKAAMELIPKIIDSDFRWDGVWWETHEFLAFDQLLARPWFRRRWVIQEAAFSANSVIFCGEKKVLMKHFTRAVSLVRSKLSSISESFTTAGKNMSHKGFLANFRDSPATRLLDIIEGVFDRSGGVIKTRKLSLETLVDLGTFCEATDQRDTIFALLNLANDADSMVPDYSSYLLDIFADFILHCSNRSGSSDIICRPWAPVSPFATRPVDQAGEADQELKSSIPSWIAPRDGLPFGNPSLGMNHRLHGKSLVGSSQKRVYNAHCDTKPQVRLGRNQRTNTCDGSLHAKGISLGVITQMSMRMAGGIITTECLDVLANHSSLTKLNIIGENLVDFARQSNSTNVPDFLWRTLCADRDSTGERAPEVYHSAMIQVMQPSFSPYRDNRVSNIDIEELLEIDLPEHVKSFLEVARDVVWNRRTFQGCKYYNAQPIAGLIPRYAKAGDILCIIYGCSVPVVLRKQRGENDHHYWQLIGEAYVHGHMDGEGISEMSSAMLESETVEFEIR